MIQERALTSFVLSHMIHVSQTRLANYGNITVLI